MVNPGWADLDRGLFSISVAAELAGLSAVQGLWAAVGPLLLYALFGSSRSLSVGPESTTALMTAVAIATVTAGNTALAATAADGAHPYFVPP